MGETTGSYTACRKVDIRLVVACFSERVAQPFQPFIEAVTGGGASRLDVLACVSAKHRRNLQVALPMRAVEGCGDQVCR